MTLRKIASAVLAGGLATCLLAGAALADDPKGHHPLKPSANALPAIQAPSVVAQDNSCAIACQAQHDQCRVQTKGSPACDSARQRCLQACIASKKK